MFSVIQESNKLEVSPHSLPSQTKLVRREAELWGFSSALCSKAMSVSSMCLLNPDISEAQEAANKEMLLHPWTDVLSGFCRLFAWCMTLCNCNLPCSTRQGKNGGMFKGKKSNFLLSSFQYSLLPATVPFSIRESGAIFSTKEFDYEKDPHW